MILCHNLNTFYGGKKANKMSCKILWKRRYKISHLQIYLICSSFFQQKDNIKTFFSVMLAKKEKLL